MKKKTPEGTDPRTRRWLLLLDALINFHGNMSKAAKALGVANSTFASWRRRKSADMNLLVPKISTVLDVDEGVIMDYLSGVRTLPYLFGEEYSPILEKPVVIRPRGRARKKAQPIAGSVRPALPPVQAIEVEAITLTRAQDELAKLAQDPSLLDDMPIEELVALMAEVTARIRFRLLATPTEDGTEINAIQHFADWLGSYLEQQGTTPQVFTRQMAAVMRDRFSADEVATLVDEWLSGKSRPNAFGLDSLSRVLRDGDGIPISAKILCENAYPDGRYPDEVIERFCDSAI